MEPVVAASSAADHEDKDSCSNMHMHDKTLKKIGYSFTMWGKSIDYHWLLVYRMCPFARQAVRWGPFIL